MFDIGLTSAKCLFARRRMGKTEFLKQDLIPAAKEAGYTVVYSNLWELEIDPATALAYENALRRLGNKNLITKIEYGKYQFEDEGFYDWVGHLVE